MSSRGYMDFNFHIFSIAIFSNAIEIQTTTAWDIEQPALNQKGQREAMLKIHDLAFLEKFKNHAPQENM